MTRGRAGGAPPDTEFGRLFSEALERRGKSRTEISKKIGTSLAYVSALSVGAKFATSSTVDRLADALELDDVERVRLHRAAARDAGFKLDLPDDF